MTKEDLFGLIGNFTWDFGCHFFIETGKGNFVWSDPDYMGDNVIRSFNGTAEQFFTKNGKYPHMYGRDKGKRRISDFCGPNVTFSNEPYEFK